MEKIQTARMLFLGEQDGSTEQELKSQLWGCFSSHAGVISAYLLRVSYEATPGPHVALCINSRASNRAELLPCIEKVFRKMFRATQHMDILFVSEQQLAAIDQVATPFYTASA
jgi:hypothetical protein